MQLFELLALRELAENLPAVRINVRTIDWNVLLNLVESLADLSVKFSAVGKDKTVTVASVKCVGGLFEADIVTVLDRL